MLTLFLFSVSLALTLYGLLRRRWELFGYALMVCLWLSIGVMAMLTKYNHAAVWVGLI